MKTGRNRGNRGRHGFILLEVIVGMTLLALILTPLAGMVYKITARSHTNVGGAYRNGVLLQNVNLLESLPFDSLLIGTVTTSKTALPYAYTRRVTVELISQHFELKAKKVTLIITPTNPLYRPDTTIFVRSTTGVIPTFNSLDPP